MGSVVPDIDRESPEPEVQSVSTVNRSPRTCVWRHSTGCPEAVARRSMNSVAAQASRSSSDGDPVLGDHRRHPLAAGVDVDAEAAELVVQGRASEVGIEQRVREGERQPGDVVRQRLAIGTPDPLEDDQRCLVGESQLAGGGGVHGGLEAQDLAGLHGALVLDRAEQGVHGADVLGEARADD